MKRLLLAVLAVLVLSCPAPGHATPEDAPVHLGECEPVQIVKDSQGERFVIFQCSAGAVVFMPEKALPEPVIPPSEDETRI